MKAFLILEDGTVFTGTSIGSREEIISEIVFNTSVTGYLEVLTDPSYAGQSVVLTYPLIGNYGVTPDMESKRAWAKGCIVHELSRFSSNFRCQEDMESFLEREKVTGIAGIDTRSLTKLLREQGTMNGMITTKEPQDLQKLLPKIRTCKIENAVLLTTCKEPYILESFPDIPEKEHLRTALLDLGAKENIARCLQKRGCQVTVFPANTPAEKILENRPDGIMISNGPGDPAECTEIIKEIKELAESGIPIFAICLGHQLMALANGARTYKLKYGHRGGNHPVKNLKDGRVYISSQNHGYAVDFSSVDPLVAKETFVNVNDGTNEGLKYKNKKIWTVQFHPEANPGPKDLSFLFDDFINHMKGVKACQGTEK